MSTVDVSLPPPLDTLSTDDQGVLASYLEAVRFAEDEPILQEGAAGDGCYIIEAGKVRIEVERSHVDTDNVLEVLEPGAFVGELSLLDREPRSASAVADTDVTAYRFSTEAFEALCSEHPRLGMKLYQELGRDAAQKLRQTTARLTTFVVPDEPDPEVEDMVARAVEAQRQFQSWDEERVDALLEAVAQAVYAEAESLAEETVEETRLGHVGNKAFKNEVASMGVYQSLAGRVGSGPLREHAERRVVEIAGPAGVVFGMVPVTNPVATAVFKALIGLKARNAVVLSFHRGALGVGNRTGAIMQAALREAGAPVDLIQWIKERSSRKKTAQFMGHEQVALVLATGGKGMVEAAYSSGTPALGVGPGNAPAWIRPDADLDAATRAIMVSKTFDHGLICGAEHNLVVDAAVRDAFVDALEARGAAVLSPEEAERFKKLAINSKAGRLSLRVIGRDAGIIAERAGIERDHDIRLIVVPTDDARPANPLAGEKMAPLLSLFTVDGVEEGMALCKQILEQEGTGHTAIIHTTDEALAQRFGVEMPASRILVNSPGSQGVVGITTGLEPSFTLGCGTFGGNSTTDNVTYRHLYNVKRLAHYTEPEA